MNYIRDEYILRATAMRIIGILLVIFGGLGVFAQTAMVLNGEMHRAVSGFALFGGVAALGFLGILYRRYEYKGGRASIIGVILAYFGALKIVATVEEYGMDRLGDRWLGLLLALFIMVCGAVSIRRGHTAHREKSRPGTGIGGGAAERAKGN